MAGDPEEQDLYDMDARLIAMKAYEFREYIVGIKLAHYKGPDWTPVKRTVEAGQWANIPVMIDFEGLSRHCRSNVPFWRS